MKKLLILIVGMLVCASFVTPASADSIDHYTSAHKYCVVDVWQSKQELCYLNSDIAEASYAGNYLLGTDYRDANYQGGRLYWVGTDKCSKNSNQNSADIPADWNDEISSAKDGTGTNCLSFLHFRNGKDSNVTDICSPNCKTFSDNDSTSSVAFWATVNLNKQRLRSLTDKVTAS